MRLACGVNSHNKILENERERVLYNWLVSVVLSLPSILVLGSSNICWLMMVALIFLLMECCLYAVLFIFHTLGCLECLKNEEGFFVVGS
jgi:hypothetical protein